MTSSLELLNPSVASVASGSGFPVSGPGGYGALADLTRLGDGAITSGTAILTSATAQWSVFDVGKAIVVQGADVAAAAFASTIQSCQGPGQVTLAGNASTTVSAADVKYGTDNTAAIQAALTAAGAAGAMYSGADYSKNGGSFALLLTGSYGYTGVLFTPHLAAFRGYGHDVSSLVSLGPNAHVRFANVSGNTTTSLNTTLQQGASLTYPLVGATLTVQDNPQTGGAFPLAGAAFTPTGSLVIGIGPAAQTVTYTGVTATGFTGVNGGNAGIVHADGQAITQGATAGRRSSPNGGFTLDGNNISTPNGYLCFVGRTTQSMFYDLFVSKSAGGGVIVATGQNNWFVQFQVQNNLGDGWAWDYGAGGNHRVKCEINNDGDSTGYLEKNVESGATLSGGYLQPTNNVTDATIFERSGGDGLGTAYFGAGVENIYNNCNFAASATTTLTATAALPTGTLSVAKTNRFPSGGGTALVTDGVNTDTIAYTGKTATTLTGVTGGTHTYAPVVTSVALVTPKVSMLVFRKDLTGGSTQSSAWRFNNCVVQGDQNLTRAVDAVGGVTVFFTGVNNLKIHDTIWYVDDTASIQGIAREATFNTSFISQGGVKTKDQVIRPTYSPAPTTQGVPTDSTVQTNPPPQDGAQAVDNLNGIPYARVQGAWKATMKTAFGSEASLPSPGVANVGQKYYATDTAVLFYSDGTTWRPIAWKNAAQNGMLLGLSNCPVGDVTSTAVALAASGSDTLVGIFIPKNYVVSNIKWRSGGTGATFGSNNDGHWYLLIRKQDGSLMASTADQGIGALASGTTFTKAIARDAANGAAVTWTCPSSAYYLVGPNVYLGTGGAPVMPTSSGKAALVSSLLNNLDQGVSMTGQVGMTSGTPATAPGAPTVATVQPWVAVL